MTNRKVKAIFFDLDGTLADTLHEITQAMNLTLRHYNFPERNYQQMLNCINYGVLELVRRAFPEHCTPEFINEALPLYQKNYGSVYLDTKLPYDGIPEVLSELKKKGYHLGVISNKTHIFTLNLTKQIFGDDTFDLIIGQERFPGKPAPEVGYYAAKKLGIATDQIIFIGDSHVDLSFLRKNTGMISSLCNLGIS